MSARILDGRPLADSLRQQLAGEVSRLASPPGLGILLVGEHPPSRAYVRHKLEDAGQIGFRTELVELPTQASQEDVLEAVEGLNADPGIHGVVVQLPLPPGVEARLVLDRVRPEKDVDGLHPSNAGRLFLGLPTLVPATPQGILALLRHYQVPFSGRHAVVVGRSQIVGRPVAQLLLRENCTVTMCHSRSQPLEAYTRQADILVVAMGRPRHVGREHVRPGAVVVDVGIHRLPEGGLCGDVDFEAVREVSAAVTPVPGGVGPLTRAMLLANTLQAYRQQSGG